MTNQVAVESAMLRGIEAVPVTVECVIEKGLPSFTIVGMVGAGVLEGRERVRCAIKSAGFTWPNGHIIVNLAPSTMKKCSSHFDLAIAIAILAASSQIDPEPFKKTVVFGELMLDGTVVPNQRGFAAYLNLVRHAGVQVVCASRQFVSSGFASDVDIACIETLDDLRAGFVQPRFVEPETQDLGWNDDIDPNGLDHYIREAIDKRSTLLVMTNRHDEVAKRVKFWIERAVGLNDFELDEVEIIASVASAPLPPSTRLGMCRPFRAPHHSITLAGLIGGGNPIYPGEVTLAHNGVLFLEHAEELVPKQLDALRHTRAKRRVRITRADGTVEMPADCAIIATANPCPCGNFGDPDKECTCSATQILHFQNRVCGCGNGLFSKVVR